MLFKFILQWHIPTWIYMAVRIFLAAYSLAAYLAIVIPGAQNTGAKQYIFAFLTIWTYTVLVLHMVMAFLVAMHYCFTNTSQENRKQTEHALGTVNKACLDAPTTEQNEEIQIPNGNVFENSVDENKDNLTWYLKLSWILANISQHFSIIVTVIYFSVIYPSLDISTSAGAMVNDLNMHAISTVFVLIDVSISARPVRFLHFIYPTIYGVTYVIFSVIYWSTDKVNHVMYTILDWNNPSLSSAVVVSLSLVGIPLVQLLHFGIYKLRLKIYHSLNC